MSVASGDDTMLGDKRSESQGQARKGDEVKAEAEKATGAKSISGFSLDHQQASVADPAFSAIIAGLKSNVPPEALENIEPYIVGLESLFKSKDGTVEMLQQFIKSKDETVKSKEETVKTLHERIKVLEQFRDIGDGDRERAEKVAMYISAKQAELMKGLERKLDGLESKIDANQGHIIGIYKAALNSVFKVVALVLGAGAIFAKWGDIMKILDKTNDGEK